MNTATVPVYHAETSLASSRGKAVISELFVNNFGWLIAQFLTLGFSFTEGEVQWVSMQQSAILSCEDNFSPKY